MKEQIYTIPLNEAFDKDSECPFCELQKKLETFKSALQTHDFPRNESKETCKYCKMADICCFPGEVREKKEGDDEAES